MDKTIVFDNQESGFGGLSGILASLCQQRGLDPNMVMAMMNNGRNGFGGEGGWFIWVIFLFFLMGWGGGWGGNGFGGNGRGQGLADLGNLINNDNGRDLLLQAINGNGNRLGELATMLNCDINQIQGALNQLSSAVQNVNANLASQIASCCCDLRSEIAAFKGSTDLQICQQTNTLQGAINTVNSSVERGFASNEYNQQAQTNAIVKAIGDQTNFINQKFCDLEMREMQNKIDSLRLENQSLKFAESQQSQNNYLISQLQPVARPAYIVQSPYQSQMFPFYGINPYYGNNGCCCNNNGCGY